MAATGDKGGRFRRRGGRARKPSPPRRSRIGRVIRFGLRVAVAASLIVGAIVGAATVYFMGQLPDAAALLDGRDQGSVTLLDRDGAVFAWRGEQYGGELTARDVSPYLKFAIIAAEDRRFYTHIGLDPRGLVRAMAANARAGKIVQGGSTLTQQVAKNVFLTREKSYERKLKEIPMALAMELKYTKDQILSIYLNRVYLGAGTYGFEAASRRYFGKSASEVTPAEAAMLAGLLKAPSRFAPTSDLDTARARAAIVLDLMVEEGFISRTEAAVAKARPAELSEAARRETGRYFADWVMEAGPGYLTSLTTEDVRISTTFDAAAQRAAEGALRDVFESKVKDSSTAQAAIVVMSPDGAVRAMVGGRSYGASQFNRATQAMRQTGSAFKPVVYAAGLEAGLTPDTVREDRPIRIKDWEPKNYGGGYAGPMRLSEALAKSVNTIAVQVSEEAGRDKVAAMAARLGMVSPIAPGPAIALGTSEATLLEMTGMFAVFANGGRSATPYGVESLSVRGFDEPLMGSDRGAEQQILHPRLAAWMTQMMRGVIQFGTGRRAALPGWDAAGKTGTTQGARDAWFIGYTSDYVVGVWMGKDDNTPLTGVTGGGLPAEIWRETMVRLHDGQAPAPLEDGQGVSIAGLGGGGDAVFRQTRDVLVERGGDVIQAIFRDLADMLSESGRRRGADAQADRPRARERRYGD